MRGTYQVGMQIGIGFLHVIAIVTNAMPETADMVMGMVTYAVPLLNYPLV
jgi:carbonic anhydrase